MSELNHSASGGGELEKPKQSGRGWVSKRPLANGGLASESANYPQIGRVGRRRVVASGLNRRVSIVGRRRRFVSQKSKFEIWPRMRPNFEF